MLHLHTLRKRGDFLRLRDAKPFHTTFGSLRGKPSSAPLPESTCRVGLTVSKYCSKKAVERNRIKRRLRAVVRELWPQHGRCDYDYVFIAKNSALDIPFDEMREQIARALIKLNGS